MLALEYPIKILHQLTPIIKSFRKSKGLTQTDIAKRLGITQQTIQQFESDLSACSLERFFKILSILEVSLILKDRKSENLSKPNEKTCDVFDEINQEIFFAHQKMKDKKLTK